MRHAILILKGTRFLLGRSTVQKGSGYLLALFVAVVAWAGPGDTQSCPVCGMRFKEGAKTSFESTRDGKPLRVCSFTCARRLHRKDPNAPLEAHDFESPKLLGAHAAWFLIKSKNVLKELDFDMPPSVIAFETEKAAKKAKARLKDGEVVKGIGNVEKAYE